MRDDEPEPMTRKKGTAPRPADALSARGSSKMGAGVEGQTGKGGVTGRRKR